MTKAKTRQVWNGEKNVRVPVAEPGFIATAMKNARPEIEKDLKARIKAAVAAEHKDTINSPAHYTNGKVECIDAIEAATTGLEGIEAVCTGNAIKYLYRWKLKNGIEDLKKARWYLDRLIAKVEKDA